jgi:DNA primase
MLCEQPEPHSALFIWLEAQLHDHGAMPWGALREGLRGHALEAMALRLMAETQPQNPSMVAEEKEAMRESQQELRSLLNRMHIDRLKELETEAIAAAKADPSALQRYRDLQTRRRKLEATHVPLA